MFSRTLPALQHAQLNYWICIPEYIYYCGISENHIQQDLKRNLCLHYISERRSQYHTIRCKYISGIRFLKRINKVCIRVSIHSYLLQACKISACKQLVNIFNKDPGTQDQYTKISSIFIYTNQ